MEKAGGNLTGRVAIVTGGSRGIGRAIAETLVASGANVVVAARSSGPLDAAVAELNAAGEEARGGGRRGAGRGEAHGIVCDVRSEADCRALIDGTIERFDRLDILVNNAGIGIYRNVGELTVEDWDATIGTNLSGVFYCAHHALPHLKRAGESWVINIGSLAGKNAFPGGAAYNASKFGLIGFSEALMQEVRHDGVRVSYIMPGSVSTEGFGEQDWKIQPEDIAALVLDVLAMPGRTLPSRIEVRPARPPKK